ncbi:MAG TPA: serine hydrolase, partial [Ornithinibacter sp.]|nr:serine hydrolase [Ornithinibacter sp.]
MPGSLDRRRLLVGGGAAAGLAVVAGCSGDGSTGATGTASAGPETTTTSATPTASPSPTASPTPTASPSVAAVQRVEAPTLTGRLDDYLDGRRGDLGLELVDLRRGQSFRYEADEGYTYSTIKVLVLTTLLHQLQEDDEQLSTRQRRLAERMITRSDNAATEALLAQVGRDEVRRVGDL